MQTKKIVITGGPGTGKSSIINELKRRGYTCYDEVSRQIILKAQEEGIDQLFLDKPLTFSDKVLNGRIEQFNDAENSQSEFVFLDRGIPDVVAYLNYIKTDYPEAFDDACKNNTYDYVFILGPWQDIYESDNERYESFEQAEIIHKELINTYSKLNYELRNVPFGAIETRAEHIINIVKAL